MPAHMSKVYCIDWSYTCGTELISCGQDKTVKVWDLRDVEPRTLMLPGPVWRARYTVWRELVCRLSAQASLAFVVLHFCHGCDFCLQQVLIFSVQSSPTARSHPRVYRQPAGDAFVSLTLPHPPRNETTLSLWTPASLASPIHTYQGMGSLCVCLRARVSAMPFRRLIDDCSLKGGRYARARPLLFWVHSLSVRMRGDVLALSVSVTTALWQLQASRIL